MRHNALLLGRVIIIAMIYSCSREHETRTSQGAYSYYFYESTGDNQFILINGTQRKITFDHDNSNAAALESLFSLKWNVLYPNAKGKITLYGSYHKDKETFSLRHWQLPGHFQAYEGEETIEPGELKTRDTLVSSDFKKTIKNDPRIYNHPRRDRVLQ